MRLGNYVETAAAAVGITARTVRNWERTGRIDADAGRDTPHARFAESIDEARSESEAVLVSNIRLHASRDIRAAMFLLERRFPKKWGSRATGDENEAEGPRTMTELFDLIAAERDGADDE